VTFTTPFSKRRVNGSFVRKAYLLLRTPETGREIRVAFDGRLESLVYVNNEPL